MGKQMSNFIKNDKISKHGEKLIKHFESFVSHPYDDGVGVMTIGWGHAIKPGEKFDKMISEEEAHEIFLSDVAIAEKAVSENVNVDINQFQFDALVSFTFNVGVSAFKNSTLLRVLNSGDYKAAANELLRWNKGRVRGRLVELKGLTRRRNAERTLFKTPMAVLEPLKGVI